MLGFQEFDLTKESFVQNDEKRLKYWQDKIEAVISLQGAYKCVATSQLASMLVLLYAPEELANQMHDLDTAMVGTGYAGIMGNKGAVAIRFVYNGTSFCLVNSHLNAHVHNVRRRQADYERYSFLAGCVNDPLIGTTAKKHAASAVGWSFSPTSPWTLG